MQQLRILKFIIRSSSTNGDPAPAVDITYRGDITLPNGDVLVDQGPFIPHNDRPNGDVIDTQPAAVGSVWLGTIDNLGLMFFTIVEREALCTGGG